MRTLMDQAYAESGGIPLRFDLFLPDVPGPVPLVICIHGGGWLSGERAGMHDVAAELAGLGFAAACPEYRLAPLHVFPAAVQDLQRFVAFVRGRSTDWNVHSSMIAALGNSAGGHLAAMLAVTDGKFLDEPAGISTRVNAAVAICPLTNLVEPRERHFEISLAFIEQFLGGPYEGREDLYRAASPVHHVDSSSAPMLIVHGGADDIVPVGQSAELSRALEAAGVPHRLRVLPDEGHAFSQAGWEAVRDAYVEFLRTEFQGAAVSSG
jgi:acetyl esterase/lipase